MTDSYYRKTRIAAYVVLALIIPAVYLALQVHVDNRHERLLNQSDEAARLHHAFKDAFGHDEFIVVAMSGAPIFDVDNLDVMVEVLEVLEETPNIARVSGLRPP